jgi:hypothetical protein
MMGGRTRLIAGAALLLLLPLGVGLLMSWRSVLSETGREGNDPMPGMTAKGPARPLAGTSPALPGATSHGIDSSSASAFPPQAGRGGSPEGQAVEAAPSSPAPEEPLLPPPPIPAVYGAAQGTYTNQVMADGLGEIAEQFAEKVKQGGWDTTSASYQSNWSNAAAEADALLRARFGVQAYQQLQHEAAP